MNGKIETVFTLLSPLSHIGESIGPNSYLATQDMLDANGNPIEVFVYSGNALRGMWRDYWKKSKETRRELRCIMVSIQAMKMRLWGHY